MPSSRPHALDRLLALTGRHAVPVTLAVIPAHAGERRSPTGISSETGVTVAVHGWAHANHAPEDEKKQELGPHRPAAEVLAELAEAKAVIDRLFGERALPMLVPPWNRIDDALLPSLAEHRLCRAVGLRPSEAGADPRRQHACRHHRLACGRRLQGPRPRSSASWSAS